MKLYLIRHGQTEWSRDGRHTGRRDLPLTDVGIREAEEAGTTVRALAGDAFTGLRVVASPLIRARATARIIFGDGHPIAEDGRLMEFDYGDFEGRTKEEIHGTHPGWRVWSAPCPGGETLDEAGARLGAFLADVDDDVPTAVVAHGHSLRILTTRAVGLRPEHGAALALDTAGVCLIEDVRGERAVRLWNVPPAHARGGATAAR